MEITSLKAQSFRNLSDLSVEFHPKVNLIWGNNGQGKTNILEAICCLSLGRSFRSSSDKPLLQFTKPLFYLSADGEKNGEKFRVEMGYNGTQKKTKVNGVPQKRLLDFVGNIRTVTFSPDDLSLVKGGRAERRSFLDTMLCQISNKYCLDLATYHKIVEQRNKILKDNPRDAKNLLIGWNTQLAVHAAYIWLARYKATKFLEKMTVEFFKRVSDSELNINMTYYPEIGEDYWEITDSTTKEDLARKLMSTFDKNIGLELRRGFTLYGPHKDDLSVKINNMDAKSFASQGQQRLIVLAMKIAELHFIEDETEESPILLLDDIFSELDPDKIKNLMNVLNEKERQVFITTTEKLTLPYEHKSWNMNKGIIRKDLT